MVHYRPTQSSINAIVERDFPVQATNYHRRHPLPGPMFNSYGFGGYLVYSGIQVFVDGRGDLFERGGALSDYLQATLLKRGALNVLDRYQIGSCILTNGEPLAVVLGASPKWNRVYVDNVSEIFVRR